MALITHPDLEETRYPPSRRGNKNKTNKRRKKASEEETTTVETSKNLSYRVNRRVKVIRKFVPRIPKSCFEALRASELGSSERKRPFTGIPSRKFDTRDNKQYGNGQKMNWDVQAVYQVRFPVNSLSHRQSFSVRMMRNTLLSCTKAGRAPQWIDKKIQNC